MQFGIRVNCLAFASVTLEMSLPPQNALFESHMGLEQEKCCRPNERHGWEVEAC